MNVNFDDIDRLMSIQRIDMNMRLYGDTIPWRQRGKIERLKNWFDVYRQRITDAWQVLTGKAYIGD